MHYSQIQTNRAQLRKCIIYTLSQRHCISFSDEFIFLQAKRSRVGQALSSLHVGSRVGLSLDSDHCLHLHVDGQRQGMVARDVPQPCYALFELLDPPLEQVRHVLFTLLVTPKCKCAGYW